MSNIYPFTEIAARHPKEARLLAIAFAATLADGPDGSAEQTHDTYLQAARICLAFERAGLAPWGSLQGWQDSQRHFRDRNTGEFLRSGAEIRELAQAYLDELTAKTESEIA